MLETIDVLIGLTVIMLALSMAVTVITQFVTAAVNSRGRHLKRSLADLIQQVDPKMADAVAAKIATGVLTHPLVSGAKGGKRRLGSVVHREEFTKLLLELADRTEGHTIDANARNALKKMLQSGGITNPAQTLKDVRALALQLEASRPDLALNVRHNIAILQEAKSDFVAQVNTWFDQTMDRATQRFTFSTRAVTFAGAIIVAVLLQVDTVSLVNRLSNDEELRQVLLKTAQEQQGTPRTNEPVETAKARAQMEWLGANGLVTVPKDVDDWKKRWESANVPGIAITAILLSLGAPFWYSSLGRLLKLRSVLAEKDDQQREERQQVSATPPSGGGAAGAGERGDVVAVG